MKRKPHEQVVAEDGFSKSIIKALRRRDFTVERIAGCLDQDSAALHYQLRHKDGYRIVLPWDEIVAAASPRIPLLPAIPSVGHIAFCGRFEYFAVPCGDLCRAPIVNPLDVYGYRQGKRFVATKVTAHAALKLCGIQVTS